MRNHDPGGTVLQAVRHYIAEGSPFVTVSVLDRAVWVNAVQPEHWSLLEQATSLDLVELAITQVRRAQRAEDGCV